MDVITAFLHGILQENVYMEIPDGFPGAKDRIKVCRVNRALYSLCQAPKTWYNRIDSWLTTHGLMRSMNDSNLYFSNQNGKLVVLLLSINDLHLTDDDVEEIQRINP